MPFLLAMDLPVGSQVPFQTNPQLPLDPIQLAIPVQVDQNQVESFDPVARAADLVSTLPRPEQRDQNSPLGSGPLEQGSPIGSDREAAVDWFETEPDCHQVDPWQAGRAWKTRDDGSTLGPFAQTRHGLHL